MNTYTKSDLIAEVAAETGDTKARAERMVAATLEVIARRAGAQKVALKGFGTFETRERAERNGRNPATGEAIRLGPSSRLTFRASRPAKA